MARRGFPEVSARIRGYIYLWNHAVQVQASRALDARTNLEQESDALLFAVALRNLIRAVRWATAEADTARTEGTRSSKLHEALANFDAAIQDAVDIRDLIDHFDDYEREADDRRLRFATYSIWFETLHGETTLSIDSYRLPVREGAEQAQRLAHRAMEALR